MTAATFKPGDRVVVKNLDDFRRDFANALRGRVGVIAPPPHECLPGRVFVKWQPRKRDRQNTLRRCPGWFSAKDLIAAPVTEGGAE